CAGWFLLHAARVLAVMPMAGKRKERMLFIFLLVLGLLGLFLADLPLPTSVGKSRGRPRGLTPAVPPGMRLMTTRVIGRAHGKKEWEFKAERILRSVDGLLITATGVKEGLVYDEEGKPAWSFAAGYLRYYVLNRRLEAGDGVTGRAVAGDLSFQAPRITADLRRRQLVAEGPVEATGEELRFRAMQLAIDLAAETVVLRGGAEVSWSEGKLKGEEIRYSLKDNGFEVLGSTEGVEIIL
ncbi:MAG: hypothetical protein GX493_08605, partial [Firmicutes bacterium]|nr:hypothetical protein [Bacillota bacterium]